MSSRVFHCCGGRVAGLTLRLAGALPRSWIGAVSGAQWRHPLLKVSFEWCADRLRNRDGVIQQGMGRGLRFNAGHSNAGYMLGTSEADVQHTLASILDQGMTFYDIGANVGFLSLIAARLVGRHGKVVCFEPLPDNSRQIEYNAALNGFDHVDVRQQALGGADGTARFLVSGESTWGRLASVGRSPNRHTGEVGVVVARLDRVISEDRLPPPEVMKIDVEGAEVEVLAGAAETIRRYRPTLLIELHGTNRAVADALSAFGYRMAVVEGSDDIINAHWNAHVIARPE